MAGIEMRISIDNKDDIKLFQKLSKLGTKVAKKVLRSSVAKASTPMVQEMRKAAPKDTGALKRSMGKKTKLNARAGVAYAVVGPRADFEVGDKTGRGRPAAYSNTVNKRTRYKQKSFKASTPKALAIFRRTMAEGVTREAKKA